MAEQQAFDFNSMIQCCVGDDEFFQAYLQSFRESGFEALRKRKERVWSPSPSKKQEILKIIDDTLGMVGGILEKSAGAYLGGRTPSADDVVFAALAYPIIM